MPSACSAGLEGMPLAPLPGGGAIGSGIEVDSISSLSSSLSMTSPSIGRSSPSSGMSLSMSSGGTADLLIGHQGQFRFDCRGGRDAATGHGWRLVDAIVVEVVDAR